MISAADRVLNSNDTHIAAGTALRPVPAPSRPAILRPGMSHVTDSQKISTSRRPDGAP
jgi:hypothetical protein